VTVTPDAVALAHDFHVQKLLKRPNRYMTPTEFKRNQILSILIDGNRYSEIKRNKKGEIIELIPISAERVKKDHDRAEKGMILYKVARNFQKSPEGNPKL
jgi:phage portal protein BeeE